MSEVLLPIDPLSKQVWPGLSSAKFTGSRKHITVKDCIKDFTGVPVPSLGRKHYEDKYDVPLRYKPTLKVFDQHNKETTNMRKLDVKKHYAFQPISKKDRPELKHYSQNPESKEWDYQGIKTFEVNNKKSHGTWDIEETMGTKGRMVGLSRKRNLLPVRSLGDKIYKTPEYSSDFFKGPGLIPGSNFFVYKKKMTGDKKRNEKGLTMVHYDNNAMTWKDRMVIEEKREDKIAVEGIDKWEENILSEANPNWKDPEKVGPPDLFAEREKAGGKDTKKTEVKGKK